MNLVGKPNERRVVLVRHGQTAWSDKRYMGQEDVPLSTLGRAQAEDLVQLLENEHFDAIWSSPLARAQQTAAPVAAQRGLAAMIVPDLTEMDYGEFQGVRKAERRVHIREDHVTAPIPGGESLAAVARRAGAVVDRLAALPPQVRAVLVVGHYRVSQFVFGALYGRTFEEVVAEPDYRPDNGSAYAVDCTLDGGGHLVVRSGRWLS